MQEQLQWPNYSLVGFSILYCKRIMVHLLHLRILCFPRSRFSYQDILIWENQLHQISYLISGFLIIHQVFYCLVSGEPLMCKLSISILIRLGYIGEHVENLKLSWIKIQNKRCCLVTWDQGLTVWGSDPNHLYHFY